MGGVQPVIGPRELAVLLGGPSAPAVIDVRWSLTGSPGRAGYQAGHLPGAVFLDVDSDLAGPPGPNGRHPLPEPAALEATLRAAGISAATLVVVYDAADGSVAARLWWLLRWVGHRAVAVLDHGAARGNAGTAAQAAALARDGVLLDARAAPRYRERDRAGGPARWPHTRGNQRAVSRADRSDRHTTAAGSVLGHERFPRGRRLGRGTPEL